MRAGRRRNGWSATSNTFWFSFLLAFIRSLNPSRTTARRTTHILHIRANCHHFLTLSGCGYFFFVRQLRRVLNLNLYLRYFKPFESLIPFKSNFLLCCVWLRGCDSASRCNAILGVHQLVVWDCKWGRKRLFFLWTKLGIELPFLQHFSDWTSS